MMAITTAQAAETKIHVHPNSVTIWEAPVSFKHVFVGSATGEDKEDKPLITASASGGLGDRRLVLTVGQPTENLFGFGEGIIGRGNVRLYDDNGKEVAHLIVEVTPLNSSSHRVNVVRGRSVERLQCTAYDCNLAFKPKELTATETRPDGSVRREYAPTR
jgi:hypothetical protein